MEYKEMSKLYHMDSSSTRDANLELEEENRRSSDAAFHTGFETPNGSLFIAVPRELSILNEKVLRAERRVTSVMRSMSDLSANAVMRSLVLDEVVSTNAIEDIRSTRRQVKEALEAKKGSSEARRFKELATLYLSILNREAEIPEKPEDIREIYDRVMDGELSDRQVPDGKIFRKEGVDITAGGVKVIHQGLEPEEKIIEAIQAMLDLVQSDEIPAVYAAIVSHYLFEYAHPFYDGNGRTGRYLLSLFLSESLSMPTVLSLSRIILENRDAYYKSFLTVENPLNRGELTFFVYSMLELIRNAQVGIIDRLEKSKVIQEGIDAALNRAEKELGLKPQEAEATYVLMQYECFGLLGDTTVEDIAQYLNIGKQMARLHLSALEEKGVVEKRRKRNPLTFSLTETFKADYKIETPDWRIPNLTL